METEELVGTVRPRHKIIAGLGGHDIDVQWFEIIKVTVARGENEREDTGITFYRYNPVGILPGANYVVKLNQMRNYHGLREVID